MVEALKTQGRYCRLPRVGRELGCSGDESILLDCAVLGCARAILMSLGVRAAAALEVSHRRVDRVPVLRRGAIGILGCPGEGNVSVRISVDVLGSGFRCLEGTYPLWPF